MHGRTTGASPLPVSPPSGAPLGRQLGRLRQPPHRVTERPSYGWSRGGFHLRRSTTPERCSAIITARAARAAGQFEFFGLLKR